MRIRKVKFTKEGKIAITYEQQTKTRFWDEYFMSCSEPARPEFYTAMENLREHVVDMCELPENYLNRIKVKGVTFSYGGEAGVMGATITAQMDLYNSNCPLNLNTPHKASDSYNDQPADETQLLSSDCIKALLLLCEEAEAYIKGDRAQGSLFGVA